MAPECQQKNAKGLTMVAIGMNKAADEFLILDDRTREELASGKYRDQRRGTFGPPAPAVAPRAPASKPRSADGERAAPAPVGPAQPQAAAPPKAEVQPRVRRPARAPWTRSQERLALLYNEQGLRPSDIAEKLGISGHLVTQIILAARNRGKS